jgi:hypothetical protein
MKGEHRDKVLLSDKYELGNQNDADDENMTTELSDESLDYVYKRYKLLQKDQEDTREEIKEEAKVLISNFRHARSLAIFRGKKLNTLLDLRNAVGKLHEK